MGSEQPRRPLKDSAHFKVAQGTVGATVHKGSRQVQEADPRLPLTSLGLSPKRALRRPHWQGMQNPGSRSAVSKLVIRRAWDAPQKKHKRPGFPELESLELGPGVRVFRGPSTTLRRKQVWGWL